MLPQYTPSRRKPRPRIARICTICGKEFSAKAADVENGKALFCSPGCFSTSQRGKTRVPVPIHTCPTCGVKFAKRVAQGRPAKFCSRACSAKAKVTRGIVRNCLECGSEFRVQAQTSKQRYCSNMCAQAKKRTQIAVNCLVCNAPFMAKPSHRIRGEMMCCSNACRGIARKTATAVHLTCERCGKPFTLLPSQIRNGRGKHCSQECQVEARRTSVNRRCDHCGTAMIVMPYRLTKQKAVYCSKACMTASSRTGAMQACLYCGSAIYVQKRNIGKNQFCSHQCFCNYERAKNRAGRGTAAYLSWRIAVFQRDRFTCQDCGQQGGNLQAHHLKSYRRFPALRTDPNNGVTLCGQCHHKRHPHMAAGLFY